MDEARLRHNPPAKTVRVALEIRRGISRCSGPRLEAAGVDGAQINSYDFGGDLGPDPDRIARTVLSLVDAAGRRNPEPAGHDIQGSRA